MRKLNLIIETPGGTLEQPLPEDFEYACILVEALASVVPEATWQVKAERQHIPVAPA